MKRIEKLEMRGISKAFLDVQANSDVNLCIESGEVLGLLGENGAGKTTLMNILFGIYSPDSGSIRINDKEVRLRSPRDSMREGIGMIHQHFMLIENHTVLENIALGYTDAPFFNPTRALRKRLREFADQFGLNVDPDKQIWELSAGEQQRVEILKALFRNADLLIMDEPTSVLTPQETRELFAILRKMANEGHSVILISHKLEEIMEICSRVTVLRRGTITGEASIEEVDKHSLARMMLGRDIKLTIEKKDLAPGEAILDIESLAVSDDRGMPAVRDLSFSVRENEIFGIAGVSGNGQRELVEAITGLRRVERGAVHLQNEEITNDSARKINIRGITHVPEERIKFGIVPNHLVYENSVLKHHDRPPFSRALFMDYPRIKDHAAKLVNSFQVATPSINIPVKNLSGGNIQKLIVGREILASPALLVASHPTYGLDVGAAEYIREQLVAKRDSGGAVLMVSEDLEELFNLCDRIAVIFAGRFMGTFKPGERSIEEIGLMMTGSLDMSQGDA